MKEFGPSVNLGNIPPEEVIPLETLRRGLRGDTLKQILLASRAWEEVRARRLARSHLADRASAPTVSSRLFARSAGSTRR